MYFSAATNVCGVSVAGVLGDGLGGVGTGGPVPAPGIGRVVQVLPALPQTPRRTSPMGGDGQGAGAVVEDVDMGVTNSWGVVPASGEEGIGCGCNSRTVLAVVRREMASPVRRMREEVMGALSLLLVERRLETWEEYRRLKNIRGRLERERVAAQREHEVLKMAEKVSAERKRQVAKEREAAVEVGATAKRQEAEEVPLAERQAVLLKNLDELAECVRGA